MEIKDICKKIEFADLNEVSAVEEITKIENNSESLDYEVLEEEEGNEQKNEGNFNDLAHSTPQTLYKTFSCNQCDYESSYKHNLARHVQSHVK